jgi:hypothetical protein
LLSSSSSYRGEAAGASSSPTRWPKLDGGGDDSCAPSPSRRVALPGLLSLSLGVGWWIGGGDAKLAGNSDDPEPEEAAALCIYNTQTQG